MISAPVSVLVYAATDRGGDSGSDGDGVEDGGPSDVRGDTIAFEQPQWTCPSSRSTGNKGKRTAKTDLSSVAGGGDDNFRKAPVVLLLLLLSILLLLLLHYFLRVIHFVYCRRLSLYLCLPTFRAYDAWLEGGQLVRSQVNAGCI